MFKINDYTCNDCHTTQELMLTASETPKCSNCDSVNLTKHLSAPSFKFRSALETGKTFTVNGKKIEMKPLHIRKGKGQADVKID
jgi:putative FmdB family regulatory protein